MFRLVVSFTVLTLILWGVFELIKRTEWNSELFKNVAIGSVILISSAVTLFVLSVLF